MKAKALYDFAGDDEGDLGLKVGDIVEVISQNSDGWWEGKLKGKTGFFPGNYVEAVGDTPPSAPSRGASGGGEVATVLYDFDDGDSENLALKEGDVVTILEKNDDGWWKGEYKGKTGFFPGNYVEIAAGGRATPSGSGKKAKADPSKRMTMMEEDDETDPHSVSKVDYDDLDFGGQSDQISQYFPLNNEGEWEDVEPHYIITVHDPQKRKKFGGMKKYMSYEIRTEPNGWVVERRYKHFDWLRGQLVMKFPSVCIPQLPSKQQAGRFQAEFLEKRRRDLEQWLYRMGQHPVIRSSAVFIHFLEAGDSTWKAGKRASEKDPQKGALFFRAVQVPQPRDDLDALQEEVAAAKAHFKNFNKNLQMFYPSADVYLKNRKNAANEVQELGKGVGNLLTRGKENCPVCCWKPECTQCSLLRTAFEAIQKTSGDIAAVYEGQTAIDGRHVGDNMQEYTNLIKSFHDVFKMYDAAENCLHKVENTEDPKRDEMIDRFRAIGHVTLAECEHFHQARLADLKTYMLAFVQHQAAFHEKISQMWRGIVTTIEAVPAEVVQQHM